ncbi:hypothetical protein GcM1_178003 [Golovinomyces cichoracearum]|uniref:Uncharacterized protein n=1 Tax=Golovinomyces cichoracearum TaxID=62708 RepID=A0A420J4U6_9PEZI|nr:hypothetical protein GcM1_178003 [Golovinomyces cichoracearum]
MEKGIVKITKSVFKWSGINVKLMVHYFGDPQTRSNPLLDPELITQFSLRRVMKGNYYKSKWAVKCSESTPSKKGIKNDDGQ